MRKPLLLSFFVFASFLLGGSLEANALEVNVLNQTEIVRTLDEQILLQQQAVARAQQELNSTTTPSGKASSQAALDIAKSILESLLEQLAKATSPLTASNLQCIPFKPECGCGKWKNSLGNCVASANTYLCPCRQPIAGTDHIIIGNCMAATECRGQTYTNLEGQTQGVGGIGGVIGQIFKGLFDKLLQGGLGGAQSTGGDDSSTTCTSGTYYSVTTPTDDPCAVYDPNTTNTDPDRCSALDKTFGRCGTDGKKCTDVPKVDCAEGFKRVSGGKDANGCKRKDKCESITTTTTTTTPRSTPTSTPTVSGIFSASPSSGVAPLDVSFTTTYGDAGDTRPSFVDGADTVLDFGDGSATKWLQCPNSVAGSTSGTCATTANIKHTYTKNGIYKAAVKKTGGYCAGPCPETVLKAATITVSSSPISVATDKFSVSPTSGRVPLTVVFTHTNPPRVTMECDRSVAVNHGDGTTYVVPIPSCYWEHNHSHTYTTPGIYTASLQDIAYCAEIANCIPPILDTVAITVAEVPVVQSRQEGSSAQTQSAQTNPNLSTQVVSSQSGSQQQSQGTLPSGTRGDIQVTGSGATVFGGSRDVTLGTEVAGFYGADTFGGTQPQGIVARLCQNRPWATSVVSYVIPPSFFDGLCTLRGYSVTSLPPVTILPRAVIVPQNSAPPPPATAITPTVLPKVDIWASPARVPLGGRTSIFWNTQGVTSCTIVSSSGNFSENTPSGGAATVPITGRTTFTISCLTPSGASVRDETEVNLTI